MKASSSFLQVPREAASASHLYSKDVPGTAVEQMKRMRALYWKREKLTSLRSQSATLKHHRKCMAFAQ
jgi:hypothetical protein